MKHTKEAIAQCSRSPVYCRGNLPPSVSICFDPGCIELSVQFSAWRAQHGGLGRVLINRQPNVDLAAGSSSYKLPY